LDLPAALVAVIAVAVVAYVVTVVHAATTRTLAGETRGYRPEEYLLSWPKWLSGLVAGLLILWLLYRVRGILLPFVLGAVIAYLLNPAIDRLEKRGWRRTQAIGIVFSVFLLVFILIALLVVPTVATQARDVITNYEVYVQGWQEVAVDARGLAERWGMAVGLLPADVREAFAKLGRRAQAYALGLLEAGLAWLNRSVVVVSLLIITPVVTFWVLRDYHRLGRQILRALPERHRAPTLAVLRDVNHVAGGYLLGMATMIVVVGVFAVIVLSAMGVSFSVLLGIMTGVLYVIPYLGFPTALAVIALTMVVTAETVGTIVIVLLMLMAGNVAFDYGVTPRVVGQRVGLHPLVVIFAVLAGGALFKFVGIVLAVPLAGAIKVALLHFWPEWFSSQTEEAADVQPDGASA
jgi:predicted PurR-regulated permease PerM